MGDDKTCENCYRLLNGLNIGSRKFCNYNCYKHHTDLMNEIKKAEKNVEREKNRWKTEKIGLCKQFYETFWEDNSCMLCGSIIEKNDEKSSFLHIRLKKETEDLDIDSYEILCSECYLKISEIKTNSNVC